MYLLGRAIYRITFHPLASFPGPKLWVVSEIPYSYFAAKGTIVYKLADLHNIYGPVVRVRPDELSYITADAWKDIYGARAALPKYDGITRRGPNFVESLFSALKPEDHGRMRKNLNPGFSEKALRKQEPQIMGYVNLLIQRLKDHSMDGPVDICAWYNFTTFDIIGSLFYGESFQCLENSKYNDW